MIFLKKHKKIVIAIASLLVIYIVVCVMISVHLTTLAEKIINDSYQNRGVYHKDISNIIDEKNYTDLVAYGSAGTDKYVDEKYNWSYKINYVHTISFGFVSYTYVGDTCSIYTTGEDCTGYDRDTRIEWNFHNWNWTADDVYEYIQPEFLQRLLSAIA